MPLKRSILLNHPSPLKDVITFKPLLLNGAYVAYSDLPDMFKSFVKRTDKITIIREINDINARKGNVSYGGRTQGTLWHGGEVLGFTVEDTVRNQKIQDETAIPDNLPDNFLPTSAYPENLYTILLSGTTSSDWIPQTFYKGKGLVLSSKFSVGDRNINNKDVYSPGFTTTNLAFAGSWIHHGGSEKDSSGCVLLSNTRLENGQVVTSAGSCKALNLFLLNNNLVGPGINQQLVIVNAFNFDSPEYFEEIDFEIEGKPNTTPNSPSKPPTSSETSSPYVNYSTNKFGDKSIRITTIDGSPKIIWLEKDTDKEYYLINDEKVFLF
jgi:hypothetical protein